MKKLEFTIEHFDYGTQKRIAGAVDMEIKDLIHDGAVIKVEVVMPKKKEPKKVEKKVEKEVKKVVKKVKKEVKKVIKKKKK